MSRVPLIGQGQDDAWRGGVKRAEGIARAALSRSDEAGSRVDDVEDRLDGAEGRLDGAEGRLDGAEGRLDDIEGDPSSLQLGLRQKVVSTQIFGSFVKGNFPWLRAVVVHLWGAGGRGGTAVSGSGWSDGSGGGSGGYCRKFYLVSELASSEPWALGAPGTGAGTGRVDGGDSTFKGMTAGGGQGGLGTTNTSGNAATTGGSGGTASGGDVNIDGSDGCNARVLSGQGVTLGDGGAAPLGGGTSRASQSAGVNGNPGKFPGGGGSGALATSTQRAGGPGASAQIVFELYA